MSAEKFMELLDEYVSAVAWNKIYAYHDEDECLKPERFARKELLEFLQGRIFFPKEGEPNTWWGKER